MTLDDYFRGFETSRPLFEALSGLVDSIGGAEVRVSKSQVAFIHGRTFAWTWIPDRYLGDGHAPLVLSISLPRRDPSERWKQVVEPATGRFMHHLEVFAASELDREVRDWLSEARSAAARPWPDSG